MKFSDFSITAYGIFDTNIAFPKVTQTPNRTVNVYEMDLITADCQGSTFLDGKHIPLKAGTLIFAKPGQVRRSILPFKCLYMHIFTSDSNLRSMMDVIPDSMVLIQPQEMIQLFHEMIQIESDHPSRDNFLVYSCAMRLLHLCAQIPVRDSFAQENTVLHQKRLLELKSFIQEHLSEDLTLSVLASECNLSPTYFHRLFTDFFRKTPSEYILDARIAAAKQYLLSGDHSLSQIAALCGFSSHTYFCYKFRHVTGKTPTEFRKEMLGRLKIM